MGVLTKFLLGDADDASRIKAATNHSPWEFVDAKGHGVETLAGLWAILDPKMKDHEAEERFQLQLLTEDDDEGPWVFVLPVEFVMLVSAIDEGSIANIHASWCQHDELDVLDDEDASYVMESLKDLIRLSDQALKERRSLLMWICL